MYSLIVAAKLNDVDPRAWLTAVLVRIADYPVQYLHELLPWNWRERAAVAAAAACRVADRMNTLFKTRSKTYTKP